MRLRDSSLASLCLCQAERVLKTLEDNEAIQALLLRNRIKYCRYAQNLGELAERKKTANNGPLDWKKIRESINGMNEKELPFMVAASVLEVEAVAAFDNALLAKTDSDLMQGAQQFVRMLSPFPLADEEEEENFDAGHPKLHPLVAKLMSSAADLNPMFDACAEEEDSQSHQEAGTSPAERWEACERTKG